MAEKPYLSPTSLSMFTDCGLRYFFRYVEGRKVPPGVAMVKGSAVHKGAELNFKQKKHTRKDLPRRQIVDASAADFEKRAQLEGVSLSDDEAAKGKKAVMGEALDSTVRMAELYADDVAPCYQPVLVEEKQRITVPESTHDLLAVLDLADDKDRILEIKTGAKKKPQAA